MKYLVTGACGFIGRHLSEKLSREGEVMGICRQTCPSCQRQLVIGRDSLEEVVEFKPDVVFHLAGQSHVGKSWEQLEETYSNNFLATVHLLDALASAKQKPVFLLASSAAVYGAVPPKKQPIKESVPPAPLSHYGVSKLSAEEVLMFYRRVFGIKGIVVRLFNQIGPGQRPAFAASAFARAIAEAEKGLRKPVIEVGNLQARRDFTDVRDGVEALFLLSRRGKTGQVYNLGSGRVYSIGEILEILFSFSELEFKVEVKRSRLRKADVPLVWADIGKLNRVTGWTPSIPMEKTLLDILNWWRKEIE